VYMRKTIGITAVAIALVITFYDVQPNFVFSLPGETEEIDSEQEALYSRCYEIRDEQLHAATFATIDNPDVQKEFINTKRAQAASDCRDEYPQQWITVRQPISLQLLDLQPRYW